jgi:heme-degrading monooxygenase HmoA
MIAVFVTFSTDREIDRDRVMAVAEKAAPAFDGMPGLRSKVFTYDAEAGTATNVYVWESESAARAFFSDELREQVTGLYGVAPEVRFAEVVALVENRAAVAA